MMAVGVPKRTRNFTRLMGSGLKMGTSLRFE